MVSVCSHVIGLSRKSDFTKEQLLGTERDREGFILHVTLQSRNKKMFMSVNFFKFLHRAPSPAGIFV